MGNEEITKKPEDLAVGSSGGEKPLPKWIVVIDSLWQGLLYILTKVVLFVWDIVWAIISLFIKIYYFFIHAYSHIKKWVLDVGHKFRYNDLPGRLSFVFFGTSSFAHKQYVNGALYALFEVGYIVVFALFGAKSIGGLATLGTFTGGEKVCDPETGACSTSLPDNSLLFLIYGILWSLSLFLFFYVWHSSIESGYRNYRISKFDAFNKRIATYAPLSNEIENDINEHELYVYSYRELKDRYSLVYEKAQGLGESPMDKQYGVYLLNNTIESALSFHRELLSLNKKLAKIQTKKQAAINNPIYVRFHQKEADKVAAYQQAFDQLDQEYQSLQDKKLRNGLSAEEENKFASLQKSRHSAQNKLLWEQNVLMDVESKQEKHLAKYDAKAHDVKSLIEQNAKSNIAFVEQDSVKNNTLYGKFNVYYRQKSDYEYSKMFYQNYAAIVKAYDEGLHSNETANKENVAKKAELLTDYQKKVADINKNYAEIFARRQSVLDRLDQENTTYEEECKKINASSESKEAKDKALKDARFTHMDHLKTIKGVLLSLPSVKDVKKGQKEDLKNVYTAYHRDDKAMKTNYTAEEYAAYSAKSYMLVNLNFNYGFALSMIPEVAKHLPEDEVAKRLSALGEEEKKYIDSYPTCFDGRPSTFKEQVSSLMDKNFHLTLLALPILGVIFFTIMPLFLSILVAFTNFDGKHTPPTELFTWAGFDNFIALFNPDPTSTLNGLSVGLSKTFTWTIVWAILATFSNYFLGIIYALMINKDGIKFKNFWRFVFVLSIAVPQFISLIALSVLLKDTGAFGEWWLSVTGHALGFGTDTTNEALVTKVIIILVNIWVGIPYTILSTSGILMNIPKDLYESSRIDGASPSTQFFKITLPYIFFVTGPSLIQTFIGNINNFGVIYFLTGGGPTNNNVAMGNLGYTDLLITYIYKLVTDASKQLFGLASTIGIIVFILCAFTSMVVYNRSSSATQEDQFQ